MTENKVFFIAEQETLFGSEGADREADPEPDPD